MSTPRADRLLERIEGLTAQRDDEPGLAVSVTRGADVVARRHVGIGEPRAPGAHRPAHPVPHRLGVEDLHGGGGARARRAGRAASRRRRAPPSPRVARRCLPGWRAHHPPSPLDDERAARRARDRAAARRLGHGAVAHARPARPRPADHRGQRAPRRPVHVRQRERAAAGRAGCARQRHAGRGVSPRRPVRAARAWSTRRRARTRASWSPTSPSPMCRTARAGGRAPPTSSASRRIR